MRDLIHGTFHFHSTYSHDGKSTLSEIASTLRVQGLSFCIMTDHFEDFDAAKFDRYVQEADAVTKSSGFLMIPGVEVDLAGLHTIVFPATEYAGIARLTTTGEEGPAQFFKVLAHPTKYPFDAVVKHLEKYRIDGVELWNQQADGRFIPPMDFLGRLGRQSLRNQYRYFFGCDIHNVKLTVSNVLSITSTGQDTPETVVKALIEGDFVSQNGATGIEYRNGLDRTDFDTWLQTLSKRSYYHGKIMRGVRSCLKPIYSMLPRDIRHSLNDVKNFVRNKV